MAALPVAERWFRVEQLDERVARITEPHVHPLLSACAFVVEGGERTAVIDTGLGVGRLREAHPALGPGTEAMAILTHAHFDHTGSAFEFAERLVHPAEAGLLAEPEPATLRGRDFDPDLWETLRSEGIPYVDLLLDAVPAEGFDIDGFQITPAPATATITEGEVIDLGATELRVLHLPGHSPGSVGLLDERRGELFAGDAVYDVEPLLDDLPESDRGAYRETMARLRELEVAVVHGGHGPSFDRARLVEIADAYLDGSASGVSE